MELNRNTIHHMKFQDGLKLLPDKCANLMICDPPYFRVKGEFDFQMTWEEWLQMHEELAQECKRVMADNGTLFLWGIDRKQAYQQIIFDKWFNLFSTIVWEKPSIANEWESRRTFPERGKERLLMYGNDYEPGEWEQTGWERVMEEKIKPRHPFANYLKSEFKRAGKEIKDIRKWVVSELGFDSAMINRWLEGSSIMKPDVYQKFRKYLNQNGGEYLCKEYEYLCKEYEELRKEYEELRKEYEELRRPFDNYLKLTDVWRFSNGNPSAHDHDTPKPEKLTRALILTCSRPGDLVLVPFAGSGTECAMAAKEGRQFIGFDTNEKYVKDALKRCEQYTKNRQLTIMDALAKTG